MNKNRGLITGEICIEDCGKVEFHGLDLMSKVTVEDSNVELDDVNFISDKKNKIILYCMRRRLLKYVEMICVFVEVIKSTKNVVKIYLKMQKIYVY